MVMYVYLYWSIKVVQDKKLIYKLGKGEGKGTVHPRTGHESPEGELMYSSTFALTLALDGSGWSTSRPGRFIPGKGPVPNVQQAGWAPGPV
jgi:hypothetical protein